MKEELRKSRTVEWGSLLICVLLIAAIALSGVLSRPKIWPDVQLDYLKGKKAFSTQDGDAYGTVASGPYYDLPAGTYRIKWQIDGDGDNRIRLSCSNDAQITPSVIELTAGQWEDEAYFEIKEPAHSFSVNVEFASGTWMEVYNIRLYSPEYTDHAWSASILILALWLYCSLKRRGKISADCREALILLGLAVAIVSMPALEQDTVMGWDVEYHAARIMNAADGLKHGQFPVRVGGFSYNGYGAATSIFYPDLLLYPLAGMVLGGASISYVLNVSRILASALAAVGMYMAAKRMFRNHTAALCAAILYVCSAFRVNKMYDSLMLGQMLAMGFIPLFVWALWEVIFEDREKWPLLAVSATLIVQSHMLSTLLSAVLAVAAGVAFLPRILKEKRLPSILKAIAAALMMNLTTLIPMATTYLSGVNSETIQFGFAESALEVKELLISGNYLGLPFLLGMAALILGLQGQTKPHREIRMAAILAAAGGFFVLLTTEVFPWSYVVALTGGLVEVLQFAWRFFILATVLLALCCGYGYMRLLGDRGARTALLVLALCAVSIMPYVEKQAANKEVLEFGEGANPYMIVPEYQFEGTDVHDTRSRRPILTGDVELTQYEKDGTRIEAQVSAAEGGEIAFPLFGFDGYAAELNGERVYWWRGENNRLTVDVPADTQGTLRVWFAGNTLWKAMDVVSLLSAAVLALYVWRRRKNGMTGQKVV